MSTMKTNIAKREKSLMAAKVIGSLMAIAVLAIVIFSTNVVTQADEMEASGKILYRQTRQSAWQTVILQDIPAVVVESDNNRLQFSILVYVSYVSL